MNIALSKLTCWERSEIFNLPVSLLSTFSFLYSDNNNVLCNQCTHNRSQIEQDMVHLFAFKIWSIFYFLTHWGRVTHICVSDLTIIGSDNGLSPDQRQAIIWTNAGILLIRPLGTNFSKNSNGIQIISLNKMHLNILSVKWHPFCLGLNVLTCSTQYPVILDHLIDRVHCILINPLRSVSASMNRVTIASADGLSAVWRQAIAEPMLTFLDPQEQTS